MPVKNDLISRMNSHYGEMSKGQRILAAYITDNYDKAVFLTAAKLGEAVGISESTVVRFAASLGYRGFPEFQKAMEELIQNKLDEHQEKEVTFARVKQSQVLEAVLKFDRENIDDTLKVIDHDAFDFAVDQLVKADHVYIVGLRECASLAQYLGFELHLIRDNVRIVGTNSASEIFEQLIHLGPKDLVLGISFPRYSMRTLKAMEFARDRNAMVISLTDSIHSPMNLYSSCNLLAKSDMTGVMDSMAAPFSVINALVTAVSMKKKNALIETLTKLETIWEDYQVYGSDEMEPVDDSVKYRYRRPDKK